MKRYSSSIATPPTTTARIEAMVAESQGRVQENGGSFVVTAAHEGGEIVLAERASSLERLARQLLP